MLDAFNGQLTLNDVMNNDIPFLTKLLRARKSIIEGKTNISSMK